MGSAVIGPYGSGSTDYVLSDSDSGVYDLVNLCANYDNNQALVCDRIELIAIDDPWTATVDKTGDGNGVVTSSPSGLDCGGTCGAEFFPGTMVELSATPAAGSVFSGWSGESCEGEQTCRLTMTSDKTVEAEFTGGAPIADFSADATIGDAPFTVTFTDASGNSPVSWQWDFDNDGAVDSTLQNPSFQYEGPGVYTVELTVANSVGTDTITKKHYITAMNPSAGTVYETGPGKTYESTRDVGLHLLQEGDVVRIYAKPNREPYVEKFIVAGVGTEENPIRVVGIPDDEGNKPVFYGYNAQDNTNYGNYYWNEDRQIVLIGQYGSKQAEHIVVEGLEVHGAVYGVPFLDDSGQASAYTSNAAGIRISTGTAVVKDCDVHGNENGIFASNTEDAVLEYCHIHDNGVHTSSYLQHNIYHGGSDSSGSQITVQYCHIGELLNDGQQAKITGQNTRLRSKTLCKTSPFPRATS